MDFTKGKGELTEDDVRQRLVLLKERIECADESYYTRHVSFMSDAEYDDLRRCNRDLESRYPHLACDDSPEKRVGFPVTNKDKTTRGRKKISHSVPMLSLEDVAQIEELDKLFQSMRRFLNMENIEDNFIPVIAEPKIDGVSLSVSYRNGVLLRAATRGDGYVGDDVTKNIQAVEDIPKVLNSNAGLCPDFVEIRGEIYMLRTDFEELKMREKTDITKQFTLEFTDFKELNTQKKTGGKLKFSNPRNAASGALFHLTEQRPLKFFAYDWVTSESAISNSDHAVSVSRYRDMLERIKAWGIPVNPLYAYCETLKDVLDYYSMLVTQRMQEPYDMDGIVCKIDDLALRQRLGCRDRTPRWAIAYKFPAKRATTVLEEIKLQIGQTGTLTPVAILQPIDLGGASISRASLHNEKFIREKDLRVGDTVVIERAGDVIPYVIKVLDPARQGRSSPYQFPDLCPFCGADIVLDGEVRRCAGGIGCSAQAIERLRHFVSRRAFNILGLGKEQVRFLWNNGFVREFADIFTLEEHQSKVNHSGLGEKLTDYRDWAETYVDNLFYTIKCQRTIAFDRFLYALGIRNVGVVTAERIAAFYECWENFYQSTMESCRDNKPQEALISLNDIGSAVSESILDFFQDEKNCHEVLELCKHVTITPYKQPYTSGACTGKRIMFTGKLSAITRNEAKQQAVALGAQLATTISSAVDILVVGDDPGKSKLQEAESLDIKIWSGKQWENFVAEQDSPAIQRNHTQDNLESQKRRRYVLAGRFLTMTEAEVRALISALGGQVATTVSASTDVLIVGGNCTKSLDSVKMAEKYKVEIFYEDEWRNYVREKGLKLSQMSLFQ